MTNSILRAQQAGSKYALQATLITELLLAGILLTFLLSSTGTLNFFGWISFPTILVFVLSTLLGSYVAGQRLGVKILVRKNNSLWTCYLLAIAVVVLSTLVASSFAFIVHFLSNDLASDYRFYYLVKPIVWAIPLSILPVLIAGTWYRNQMEKQIS